VRACQSTPNHPFASIQLPPSHGITLEAEPGALETALPQREATKVLRIVSGAPLTRREVRVAGIFALVWFAMDGFWFISTLNHWFEL
jgi:hypothetical protein